MAQEHSFQSTDGQISDRDYLGCLNRICGYYECVKDAQGKRLSPLVGYHGRDESGRQYVGEVYVNGAKAEEYPTILTAFSRDLAELITPQDFMRHVNVFCGAPEGGKTLAFCLASFCMRRYVYPEKKVLALATKDSREKSQLVFSRHSISAEDGVVIVEDVLNNFSTTEELISLIRSGGGTVHAIVAILNRSTTVEGTYASSSGGAMPVHVLVRKIIPQYKQDDPYVADDIKTGNVVWKPKIEWGKLTAHTMRAKL